MPIRLWLKHSSFPNWVMAQSACILTLKDEVQRPATAAEQTRVARAIVEKVIDGESLYKVLWQSHRSFYIAFRCLDSDQYQKALAALGKVVALSEADVKAHNAHDQQFKNSRNVG